MLHSGKLQPYTQTLDYDGVGWLAQPNAVFTLLHFYY
jgi:hypothetical protein